LAWYSAENFHARRGQIDEGALRRLRVKTFSRVDGGHRDYVVERAEIPALLAALRCPRPRSR